MAKRSRSSAKTPKVGALESNVDAILRARGLELNAAPELLIERASRGGLFAADGAGRRKGEKTIQRNVRRLKAGKLGKKKPAKARGKQLRDARRA
jgi:hypothetical protein